MQSCQLASQDASFWTYFQAFKISAQQIQVHKEQNLHSFTFPDVRLIRQTVASQLELASFINKFTYSHSQIQLMLKSHHLYKSYIPTYLVDVGISRTKQVIFQKEMGLKKWNFQGHSALKKEIWKVLYINIYCRCQIKKRGISHTTGSMGIRR